MQLVNNYKRTLLSILAVTALAAVAVSATSVLSRTRGSSAISITVSNRSQREIRHVYLAAGDPNNWGPDQLNGSSIAPGGSQTLTEISCGGSTIRVIAEDQNGCFVYDNAPCDANQNWEINDSTTPDCGN